MHIQNITPKGNKFHTVTSIPTQALNRESIVRSKKGRYPDLWQINHPSHSFQNSGYVQANPFLPFTVARQSVICTRFPFNSSFRRKPFFVDQIK